MTASTLENGYFRRQLCFLFSVSNAFTGWSDVFSYQTASFDCDHRTSHVTIKMYLKL